MKQKLADQLSIRRGNCSLCAKPSTILPLELLPTGGVFFIAIHDKGKKVHKWAKFEKMEDAGKQSYIKNPKYMICPKCDKRGRISWFVNYPSRPYTITYYLMHEKLEGTWGKSEYQKRRRCYIYGEHRIPVLKKLGYHIPIPTSFSFGKLSSSAACLLHQYTSH